MGGVGHWSEGVSSVRVGEVSWLGVSAPLAQSLGAPGNEGGGGSGVSSNSGQTVSVAVGGVAVGPVTQTVVSGVTVMTIESISLRLSIGAPLAIEVVGSAAKAGGADSRSTHSGPVGVGVVESWGSIDIPGVGLSLAGGDGDNGSSNLE